MRTVAMADWKATRYQKKLIKQVLKSGRLTYGDKTRELEEQFADLHDRAYGLFTSSGTAALKIALHALKDRHGWKDGDEVIIPAVTFVATMNIVTMNNLKPVLVDVGPDVNMNPDLIEKAITKKTRAIIPVHLLGQPADMWKISAIAAKHNLKIIEDSCETMFVMRDGLTAGSVGDVACFSSYIAHLMVTGIGGFALTNDQELATVMRSMMFHGRDESYLNIDDNKKTGKAFTEMVAKRFYFPRFGYSDRMTELEACLGLGDLKDWEGMIEARQENARYLIEHLEDLPVAFPIVDESLKGHAFMFFPMVAKNRDGLVEYLEKRNIHTRHMMPLTTQPLVKKAIKGNLDKKYPMAHVFNQNGILLGCHQYLTKADLNYMIKHIRGFYESISNWE